MGRAKGVLLISDEAEAEVEEKAAVVQEAENVVVTVIANAAAAGTENFHRETAIVVVHALGTDLDHVIENQLDLRDAVGPGIVAVIVVVAVGIANDPNRDVAPHRLLSANHHSGEVALL